MTARTAPDIEAVGRLLREVAAAEIMPRFRRLRRRDVWHKRPGSVVTVADSESERRLVGALRALVPGSLAVAEEDAEDRPEALARLDGAAPVWIVDPLDGTSNFAAGRARFALIVAYAVGGEVAAGWILDPVNDRLVSAERGAGAWRDGERLRLARAPSLAEMRGSLSRRLRENAAVRAHFAELVHIRSCGIEYLGLATGALHFAHYRRLKPWDHAAGHLIHGEAGGFAACLDGAPYRPNGPEDGGLLLAPDRGAWEAVAAVLRPALAKLA